MNTSRREFIKLTGVVGGGLVIGFHLPTGAETKAASLNAYVQIRPDNTIIIAAKNPELGQGVKTALPMIVAEELDVEWAQVEVIQSAVDYLRYGSQFAWGSHSVPDNWIVLRRVGASARAMLVQAAARQWDVAPQACSTQSGRVSHPQQKGSLSYGELASAAAGMPIPGDDQLKLKSRDQFRLIGQRISGVDNRAIVTGQPLFGIDQQIPGLHYAVYEKCPATGGTVKTANLEEVRKLPGVSHVFELVGNGETTELMPGVAIIANSTWAAFSARKQLKVEWELSDAASDSWTQTQKRARELAAGNGEDVVVSHGAVESALAGAGRSHTAFYAYPYVAHAAMEPQNCSAHYHDGSCDVWASSQTPQSALGNVAGLLNIPTSAVTLHQTRCGGGFGRRLMNDTVCEAAAISQRAGVPVKLQWSREDDMAHDFYRVGGFHALRGGLDEEGRVVAWDDHFITFSENGKSPSRGGDMKASVFPVPMVTNARITRTQLASGIPSGYWRAPGSNAIAFAVQSFIHELAATAGRDHLEFLLELMAMPLQSGAKLDGLNPERAARVITAAAEQAGWHKPRPAGTGLGLAFYYSHRGHVAEVAEVSVDKNRKLALHRVTVAADVGPIINLSGAESQVQGSVIDGFSTMMGLELSIEGGRIQESNFHQYRPLRMPDAPQIDVHFLDSDYPPTGLGEPALPPLAPAVGNAIFSATGIRVRELPLAKSGFSLV
ncbi:MAG: xanthine dehydrogenase family protein molybdopterin-binding subunit [Halieaceae bacterium]|jgi:isoquinoline 1-oxidoreductase subunit beta|nr:xanthine dehydrogenase family protein molybdopterin-binding subunit [Halieaceae bacterium]